MNIFEKTGKAALGSRLRFLTTQITEDAARIYELYGVEDFSPKWFPVFFVMAGGDTHTITGIASEIGHSQPSVTKIVKEMARAGLVNNNLQSTDKRRNLVALSEKGLQLVENIIRVQCGDIEVAIDGIIAEATHNLWEALAEWEFLLQQKSMFRRVQEQKKIRESRAVQIVDYDPQYHTVFKTLNEEWIASYFEIEAADRKALDNPGDYILDKGGKIFVALYNGEPLGVCALIKMDATGEGYELAKMAVSPDARGKNIGWLLGQAAITAARELGASKIYLESNTMLKPAIHLYYKLGFQKVTGRATPYKRCNIQMELQLNDSDSKQVQTQN